MKRTNRGSLEFTPDDLTKMRKQAEKWLGTEIDKFPEYMRIQLLMLVQINERYMTHPVNSRSGIDKALRAQADFMELSMTAMGMLAELKERNAKTDDEGSDSKGVVDVPTVRKQPGGKRGKSYIAGRQGRPDLKADRSTRGMG
ncbi:MAG: hypothetical protein KAJ01_09405 [Candidatus Hydrogenedentes bacterium]|nr:hypothetical protein [Candidatus Hydrogenedentota bacterium]